MASRETIAKVRKIQRQQQTGKVRRSVSRWGKGLVRIDQEILLRDRQLGMDATGPHWVFGLVEVRRGKLRFLHGEKRIDPGRRLFGLFMPPFEIVQVELIRIRSSSRALVSSSRLPKGAPRHAVLFRPASRRLPDSAEEVIRVLRRSHILAPASRAHCPTPVAERIKAVIDVSYRTPMTLRELARRLRITPAVLSRSFKKEYGMPPMTYRHSLRVMDAMVRLVRGQRIVEVFQEVGFKDLSRFYKQFGAFACAPPGQYT